MPPFRSSTPPSSSNRTPSTGSTHADPAGPSAAFIAAATYGATQWARVVAANPRVVYLDTETTGLDGGAEIIEIALINSSGHPLFDTLVRPQRPIPPDATRIHGITNDDVQRAPTWDAIWPQLQPLLTAHTVVVYNASFDYRMVCQMNRANALPPPPDSWQCAMQQYSSFAAVWHARYGNFRWHRLDDAAARFAPPSAAPSHRALADAIACRAVVHGMANAASSRPQTTLR